MREVLAHAAALLEHLLDRRRDIRGAGIEAEIGEDPPRQVHHAVEHRPALRKRAARVVGDRQRRPGEPGRAAVLDDVEIEAAAGHRHFLVEPIPGGGRREIGGGRRVRLDRAARVQDQFLVRHLDVEDDERIAEPVDAVVAHGRRGLDDQVVAQRRLALDGARRHVHEMLRLGDRRRVAVVRPVTDFENHCRGSLRVNTRCGVSSVRLK